MPRLYKFSLLNYIEDCCKHLLMSLIELLSWLPLLEKFLKKLIDPENI